MTRYRFVRAKRSWVPEWVWRLVAHLDRRAQWLAVWLSELTVAP